MSAIRLLFFLLLALLPCATNAAADRVRVLIVDGQNNHDWKATTDALRATLRATGRFAVEVSAAPQTPIHSSPREPKNPDEEALKEYRAIKSEHDELKRRAGNDVAEAWNNWNPDFDQYQVVLLNYSGRSWPQAMQDSFVRFVKNGGGLVLIHASNNGFRDWAEFNDMIGLGYNGHRGLPEDKPTVATTIDDATGRLKFCCEGRNSGHGSQHPFVVKTRAPDHPIMRGLPAEWRHGKDELYHNLRGRGKNMTILATAFSDPRFRGTGHHEPVLLTVNYGKGRVVHTTMGHFWPRQDYWDSLYCVGFQTVLARSAEFAATGKVSLPVPKNFPGAEQPSLQAPHLVAWNDSTDSETRTKWRQRKDDNYFVMLTPEEERESFELADGFVAELVASEPMVQEPVLSVWDANGAMYVAEMRSYMQDEKGAGAKELKNGRIKRLIDRDGDGRMDEATIFVDNLNLPRMILPLDDRIAVVETDDTSVKSYRDTDGDGVADEVKLLFKGRKGDGKRSVEHQDSGLIWNLDNHIYISYNHQRYRFTDGTWRAEKQPNVWAQWGLTRDDVGRIFFSDNSKPALSIQIPREYWGHISRRTGRQPKYMPTIGHPYAPDLLRSRNLCRIDDRGGNAPPFKNLTSVCGQEVFRGDALSIDVYGDYFYCDPTIHVVRRANIENINGKLTLSHADGTNEFLISSDINFRPVSTHTGPDGCLYVVDMYRGIIQDAPWLSPGPREFIRKSGLSKNIQHGRIWRIRHRDHVPRPLPRMLDEPTYQLVRHFQNRNGWWRDTAQKLILLREDREELVPQLEGILRYDQHSPLVRLHTLWTLEGMDRIDRDLLLHILKDRDWRLRAAAVRIGEKFIKTDDEEFIQSLAKFANDREPEVAKQLILSLGWSDSPAALKIIETTVRKNLAHDGIYLAAMASLWGRGESAFIKSLRDGSVFQTIRDEEERLPVMKRWVEGIAAWNREGMKLPKEFTSRQKWLIGHGETIFYETCRSCHGPNGEGQILPGANNRLAPPLRNSPRVLGDPEKLIRIVLHGLTGPVDGKTYDAGIMPPIATLGYSDPNRVAQAVNYLRYAWGHNFPPIEVELVNKVKKETEKRQLPWTLEELARLKP